MRLIDIINGPWAITPAMLVEIRSIYAKHMRGEKLDKETIEKLAAANNVKKAGDGPSFELVRGSAIIPIDGVLAKKMNLFHAISGGASTQLIERDIRVALADPAVEQIILSVDSPGGTVDGTFELADFIYAQRGAKPVITYASGSMYSAAYAIGSAAEQAYISSAAAGVGSIGVVAAHEDWSRYEEKIGVKTTEIYSGKYKRAASQYRPLDEEGKRSIQSEVDYLYSVFVDAVARNRGVSSETVLKQMSTDVQSAFIGSQAIEAGLVDGVATLDELIENKPGARRMQIAVAGVIDNARAGGAGAEKEETIVDIKELKEKHPDLYKAVYDEGFVAGEKKGQDDMECPEHCKEESKKEGAAAELARVKSVKAVALPGHEALIEALMFDGKTSGEQAAMQVLAAENRKRAGKLADFKADGKDIEVPAVDGSAADAAAAKSKAAGEDKTLPVEERAQAAWDKDAELRAEFSGNYDGFLAYFKAEDAGHVRMFGKK